MSSSFGAMLFIVNLLIKTDSTVICVPCMLEHVCYKPFSLKNCKFERYLMLRRLQSEKNFQNLEAKNQHFCD